MSNFLQAALELAELGNAVFPLLPCGKTPLTKHGFKDATTDPSIITKWWTQWPDANIGLATGEVSSCIVLDVDGADGNSSLEALKRELGPLPNTCMARTGKGMHLYFCYPDGKEIRCRTNIARGIDVRADGGYVVAPPSVHPNGATYEWIGDETAFAELPEPWINLLLGERRNAPDSNREKRQDLTRAALSLESPSPYSEAEEARVRSALACIPATERKTWFEVGAALHWLKWGEKGFEIWDSWSQKAPDKYNDRDQRRTWESFDRPYEGLRITVGTIFHLAKEKGWNDVVASNEQPKIANTAESELLDSSQLSAGAYNWKERAITAADLHKMTFPPITYVVPGFIPEGLTLLVGRPKIGKPWVLMARLTRS